MEGIIEYPPVILRVLPDPVKITSENAFRLVINEINNKVFFIVIILSNMVLLDMCY